MTAGLINSSLPLRGSSSNSTQAWGQSIQACRIDPTVRRQELQWSTKVTGKCSLTSLSETSGLLGRFGMIGRWDNSGTEILYLIALQKQPPWSWKASFGIGAIFSGMKGIDGLAFWFFVRFWDAYEAQFVRSAYASWKTTVGYQFCLFPCASLKIKDPVLGSVASLLLLSCGHLRPHFELLHFDTWPGRLPPWRLFFVLFCPLSLLCLPSLYYCTIVALCCCSIRSLLIICIHIRIVWSYNLHSQWRKTVTTASLNSSNRPIIQ